PEGANADGALSDLLDAGADVLDGTGASFSESVRNFGDLARTLADSDDDLFATIDSLSTFTTMLAGNDKQVREATEQLARVSDTLAADREELSAALATLGDALADVQSFVADNRAALKSNVDKLAELTRLVVDRRASLAEALDVAPIAAENAYNDYDPDSGTLQGRITPLEYLPLVSASRVGRRNDSPASSRPEPRRRARCRPLAVLLSSAAFTSTPCQARATSASSPIG